MHATAQFANPTNSQVVITLTGTLGEFEKLREYLGASEPVPSWAVQALTSQISDAAYKLRSKVYVETEEAL